MDQTRCGHTLTAETKIRPLIMRMGPTALICVPRHHGASPCEGHDGIALMLPLRDPEFAQHLLRVLPDRGTAPADLTWAFWDVREDASVQDGA